MRNAVTNKGRIVQRNNMAQTNSICPAVQQQSIHNIQYIALFIYNLIRIFHSISVYSIVLYQKQLSLLYTCASSHCPCSDCLYFVHVINTTLLLVTNYHSNAHTLLLQPSSSLSFRQYTMLLLSIIIQITLCLTIVYVSTRARHKYCVFCM